MQAYNIAITGFGNAMKPLVELFITEGERIRRDYGFSLRLCGAADSKGAVLAPEGVSPSALLSARKETGTVSSILGVGRPGMRAIDMIEQCGADLLVECLPPNLPTAQPGYDHMRRALELGMHVVTANKAPLALYGKELHDLAKKAGKHFRYGSAASAALPTLEMGNMIGGTGELLEMAGIFNTSCQYVIACMRDGESYEQAIEGAKKGGFLEADPSWDLDGWDAAMKTVIQANAYWEADFTLSEVERTGIGGLTAEEIQRADAEGKAWCMVGRASLSPRRILVQPECLDKNHPLARAQTFDKALWMNTRYIGEQVHYCVGASASGTAPTMLMDIILCLK